MHLLGGPNVAVLLQSGRHEGVLKRPDRSVVIAKGVEGPLVGGHGTDTPAGAHLRIHQRFGDGLRMLLVDETGPEAMARIGGDHVDLAVVAVEGHGVKVLVRHQNSSLKRCLSASARSWSRRPSAPTRSEGGIAAYRSAHSCSAR